MRASIWFVFLLAFTISFCGSILYSAESLAEASKIRAARKAVQFFVDNDVWLLTKKKDEAANAKTRTEFDEELQRFVVAYSGTVAHAGSIKIVKDLERLGCLNVALVLLAHSDNNFFSY